MGEPNMNNAHKTNNIPEEILELLPWYALGKLSVDDNAIFENATLRYPSLQKQITLEQQMIELVSADKTLLDMSVIASIEERLKSVLNVIENLKPPTNAKNNSESKLTNSFLENLKNAFSSLVPNLDFKPHYAGIAGVAALAVSVAIFSSFVTTSDTSTSDFDLASANDKSKANETVTDTNKTVILVGFSGSADELSDNEVLKGKQIKITSPADKDGFFQISFQKSINADEIKQIIKTLLAQKETVWFAGEAF